MKHEGGMLIGDVARRTGLSARMLRHYDGLGLVVPSHRTPTGYREYSPADLARLFRVEALRGLGMSLAEIGPVLDDPATEPGTLLAELRERTRERIAREQELLARLDRVEAGESRDWTEVLDLIALMRGLESNTGGRRLDAVLGSVDSGADPAGVLAAAALAEDDTNVASALAWALAQSGDSAAAHLAPGLTAPEAAARIRAVRALAKVEGEESTELLRFALSDAEAAVRSASALALGARGEGAAAEELLNMIEEGRNDVDAAEALGHVARTEDRVEEIVARIAARAEDADPAVRLRLAQALAEFPGSAAGGLLGNLARDLDTRVSLTARYLLDRRAD